MSKILGYLGALSGGGGGGHHHHGGGGGGFRGGRGFWRGGGWYPGWYGPDYTVVEYTPVETAELDPVLAAAVDELRKTWLGKLGIVMIADEWPMGGRPWIGVHTTSPDTAAVKKALPAEWRGYLVQVRGARPQPAASGLGADAKTCDLATKTCSDGTTMATSWDPMPLTAVVVGFAAAFIGAGKLMSKMDARWRF